jgi:hypothetical protein
MCPRCSTGVESHRARMIGVAGIAGGSPMPSQMGQHNHDEHDDPTMPPKTKPAGQHMLRASNSAEGALSTNSRNAPCGDGSTGGGASAQGCGYVRSGCVFGSRIAGVEQAPSANHVAVRMQIAVRAMIAFDIGYRLLLYRRPTQSRGRGSRSGSRVAVLTPADAGAGLRTTPQASQRS